LYFKNHELRPSKEFPPTQLQFPRSNALPKPIPGLPDGLVSNQKSQFGYVLEGVAIEKIAVFYDQSVFMLLEIFYGHLVYFVVIWYIFPCFSILYQEKSGNPGRYIHMTVGLS
jgi:hypothetical protein